MAGTHTTETGYPKWQLVALPIITLLLMLICMSEYQLISQALFPDLTIWESFLVTMFLSSSLAATAVFFVLRKQQFLFDQIMAENQERRRAEAEIRRMHGELEVLVHQRTVELVKANQALQTEVFERKQSEQALVQLNQRLHTLSNRLLEIQEQERRHLARELHDQIGQLLTSLNVLMAMNRPDLAREAQPQVLEAQSIVNEPLGRVRELSINLRPQLLDDMGLLETLDWHFKRYQSQTGIIVHFSRPSFRRRLSPALKTALFRITQETLTNVARHARVKEVSVRLDLKESRLSLEIEDHGCGFNLESVLMEKASVGLSGMRERVSLINGQFHIESAPGQGTRLKVALPLSWAAKNNPVETVSAN